jgi:hypothetical protein
MADSIRSPFWLPCSLPSTKSFCCSDGHKPQYQGLFKPPSKRNYLQNCRFSLKLSLFFNESA